MLLWVAISEAKAEDTLRLKSTPQLNLGGRNYLPIVDFETWLMPGLFYTYYKPVRSDSIGTFSGFGVEYLFYSYIRDTKGQGPSHLRWYGKLSLMQSSKKDYGSLFNYTVGLDMSLERNPKRRVMVPYFGLEVGGLSHKLLGNTLLLQPTFGVHVLSKENLFINTQAGYFCPLNNFEYLRGYSLSASVNFTLW